LVKIAEFFAMLLSLIVCDGQRELLGRCRISTSA